MDQTVIRFSSDFIWISDKLQLQHATQKWPLTLCHVCYNTLGKQRVSYMYHVVADWNVLSQETCDTFSLCYFKENSEFSVISFKFLLYIYYITFFPLMYMHNSFYNFLAFKLLTFIILTFDIYLCRAPLKSNIY